MTIPRSAHFLIFLASFLWASTLCFAQTAPAISTITPETGTGYDFGDQQLGSSSAGRTISFSIFDNLSGGISNLTITVSVTSSNSDFVIDDSGCNAIASMPSAGIPCGVSVAYAPSTPGPSLGDLEISCTYVDIFSLGVLPPRPSDLVGCRPDSSPDSARFPSYLAGNGVAAASAAAEPIPAIPAFGIVLLSTAVLFLGLLTTRRQ